jgi:hypothetical protein
MTGVVLIVQPEAQMLNLFSGMTENNKLLMKLLQTIKKIVPAVLFLLYFLEVQNVLGQGRVNITDYLSQRFQHYCELVPREEVYVISDREEYIAGEELWFNTWLLDSQSSHPASDSRIIYLELLNPENKPIAQKRVKIDKGTGQGQIELPDTLSTGTYTLRAYTSWMKNFLPYNCFMKDIKVYNSFKARYFKHKEYIEEELKTETNIDSSILKTIPLLKLAVNNLKPDSLEIFISADEKYLSDNNNLFYLFIQTHGKINHFSSEKITYKQTKMNIPKTLLLPGINQITIFDIKGQPVCERYIYTPDNGKKTLSIHSPDSCGTRTKVTLELNLYDSLSAAVNSSNLSISVAPVTNVKNNMDLNEYMIFGSEFGIQPRRIIRSKNLDELPQELIDSVLQNIKSNWIDWNLILSDRMPEFKFNVEKEDHYFSGSLLTTNQQLASPGELLLLSTPGKVPSFQYATSDSAAKFSFDIPIVEGVKDLIIQPDDTSKNYDIYVESSFSDKYFPSKVWVDSIGIPLLPYISDWSINYQVGKIYESSSIGMSLLSPSGQPINLKRFYGKPDTEILLKDWDKLTTMEEVFFEIVPHFKLKKKGSVYEMFLTDPFGNILYDTPPILMIDGVIIKDPTIIANLNPEQVEKIEVEKEQYMVGDYLFNGILNVITNNGDFSNIPVPDHLIRMSYRIFDPVSDFLSPDYSISEIRNSPEPDFRNTLYWNPSVKPGLDGKVKIEFWTSDIATDYDVNVQGITSEGKTLFIRKILKVK